MKIDQALELLETYVEADIKVLDSKDRLNFWQSLSEFKRAKIQRVNYEPTIDQDKQIKIIYGETN